MTQEKYREYARRSLTLTRTTLIRTDTGETRLRAKMTEIIKLGIVMAIVCAAVIIWDVYTKRRKY